MSSPTTPEHPRLRRGLPRRPGLLLVGTLALAAATGACAEDAPGDSAPTSAVTATTPDLADTAAETPEPDAGDDVDDAVAAVEDVPTEIAATATELDEDELIETWHEDFVAELQASALEYAVIRPTGYFSDMGEYLKMARKGRVY